MFNPISIPHFSTAVQIGFFLLYFLMIVANASINFLLVDKITPDLKKELNNRVKTWFFIVTGLFILLIGEKITTTIGFLLISLFAFYEYIKAIQIRPEDRKVVIYMFLMIPIQYFWIYIEWYNMAMMFIPVYVFLSIPLFLILAKETTGFLRSVAVIYWGMIATVFCISHVPMLYTLSDNSTQIISFIFFLLLLTEINDILQYIWGKTLGYKKITPISPNKTQAGLIGGVLSTILLSFLLAPLFTPLNYYEAIGVGLIIGFGGFIGDVCMSAIKRDLGVKDYSTFLPGHGGILDRLDSLIYTAPLFFHFIHYFYY